jgi:hypothetical protein
MPRLAASDQVVRDLLDQAPGLNLRKGWDLLRGPQRDASSVNNREVVPHRCVFVLTTGGEEPQDFHDTPPRSLLMASVSVYVRSEPDVFEEGQELARNCWFALHCQIPDGFMDVECLESEPRYIGADDVGHHVWLILTRVKREEVIV